ncbi:hypothetical protein TBLA_0G01300 [Henningerozyma blattae CBS 6284]|uniref:DNA/RNA-binding protein Alba-like domain-containing protein n=1 Tax=Henningerozyma blattae (strain ATCC 34711 / CBS 6284 / DSM 70876 / NBRC 10599 / NRRL Y-10934 / UCD 77-7) TaxID=1071380 RepID=I2H6S4_HENB6|nr:hypothetical protein TBLA_0G01300 [Tetrapisispora blattae CBS 6284]CCH62076.1 hypothetical protein TBLA_0G01300 [Tetrapisispora blattae CBS 6284]
MTTFHNHPIGFELQDTERAGQFILHHIVAKTAPKHTMTRHVTCRDRPTRIAQTLVSHKPVELCLYAYGPHLQRLLAVVECVRKQDSGLVKCRTTLSSFTEHNDNDSATIIDATKKRTVPILVAVLSRQ